MTAQKMQGPATTLVQQHAAEAEHLQTQIAKRQWVTDLWEECRHDETMRNFLFSAVVNDSAIEEQVRSEIWDELKSQIEEEVEERFTDDPPIAIREALIEEFISDPPDRLRASIKDDIKADYEDEIGDLKLQIANLEESLRSVQRRKEKP